MWRIANFGVRVNVDHVIGSKTAPTVSFEEVPFQDYQFMSAAVHNKTREGEEQTAAADTKNFADRPVDGALPPAHAPKPGTTAAGGAAGDQLPPFQEEPLKPLTPGVEPPEETATFDMEGEPHTLWLVFDDPPTIFMASGHPGEQLSKKLAVAVAALRDRQEKLKKKKAPSDEHSLKDLADEEKIVNDLLADCLQVELNAAKLGIHPGERIPSHVPGFRELAKRLKKYGDLYDRPDLIESVEAKKAPAYPVQQRPRELPIGKTPRLDDLEKKEPGVTQRYVREYQDYLVNEGEQDLITYVEGRAARKMGRLVEGPAIERYERKHSVLSTKISFDVVDPVTSKVEVRVPDIFVEGFSVGDVKNVISQSFDEQMQDDVLIAKGGTGVRRSGSSSWEPKRKKPLRFDLVVRRASHLRKRTHVTQPLQEAIIELGGRVGTGFRIPTKSSPFEVTCQANST